MNHPLFEDIPINPEKLEQTIALSKAAFLAGERERPLSRLDFLAQQCRFVQKRWWLLQGLLLLVVWALLCQTGTDAAVRRCLGLAGPLLGVLLLPELWKNRSAQATEVECTPLYPLRSIYAARLTLFAGVDVVLLSVFFAGTSVLTRVTVWEMLIQFLLPFNITCAICLATLSSPVIRSQTLSLALCLGWAGAWLALLLNDRIYAAISRPVWAAALTASFGCLAGVLLGGRKQWTYEVKPLWN